MNPEFERIHKYLTADHEDLLTALRSVIAVYEEATGNKLGLVCSVYVKKEGAPSNNIRNCLHKQSFVWRGNTWMLTHATARKPIPIPKRYKWPYA